MENHPIPQDITGFQFKLIGEMTVKQFAYVASGAVIAWIFYILPLPAIIKIPIAFVFIAIGAALAFIPIDGRPMDSMIASFLKAVFNPTQYIYQKQGANLWVDKQGANKPTQSAQDQFKQFLDKSPKNKLDQKESVFFQNLNTYESNPQNTNVNPTSVPSHYFATQNAGPTPSTIPAAQKPKPADETLSQENLLKTAAVLEKELAQAKAVETRQNQIDPKAFLETHQKVLELQQQLGEMLSQKEELEKKLIDIQKNMGQPGGQVFTASLAQQEPNKETKLVRSIPQNMTQSVGLPTAPEFPNLLTGIIKDPRGNPLSNILVEVKDEEGNAVRAFKTNALGQFASATALNNGKYTITFEDPRAQNKFDTVGFETTGDIIMPMEVISVDSREELRRSLFN